MTRVGARDGMRWRFGAACGLLALMLVTLAGDALGQRRQRARPVPQPETGAPAVPGATADPEAATRETVQADVSTRRIAVTSSFSGTEIVVFGAVDNSRQTSAEAGLYDVVIVVVGTPARLVARKKSRVAGIWLNTDSLLFTSVPSYYAIASTRPLDEVASDDVLKAAGIGFDHVPMVLAKSAQSRPAAEVKGFRDAVVRLKRKQKLFRQDDYNVAFIGRSLFRASIDVPANVTVGLFDTRVFLFRDGLLLSQYTTRLDLEREGLESTLHQLAFQYPMSYGLATVLLAIGAGLLASTVFRRSAH